MANKFTRFLSGVASGALNPKGVMGTWQHASRIFVDNTFRLAPRSKFLFHVHFELDNSVVKSPRFTNRHSQEIGLLVKNTSLPRFSFESETVNQYNRKKILYKKINYDPVTINFHDDNEGIINALWALYFGYYIADRSNPLAAYDATKFRAKDSGTQAIGYRYGLDNNISVPFLKNVSIYTLSRRRFQGYTLINPIIKTWNHGEVDYAQDTETVESQMVLEYETVFYSGGTVSYDTPKGFASLHYDTTPSPLSVAGGGVANLLGQGGVLDGLESIFGDISSGAAFESPASFLGTAIKSINTYKNFKNLSKDSLKSEARNILSNPAAIAAGVSVVGAGISTVGQAIGGVAGTVFPRSANGDQGIDASTKRFQTDFGSAEDATAGEIDFGDF